jgi:hypothetical protein
MVPPVVLFKNLSAVTSYNHCHITTAEESHISFAHANYFASQLVASPTDPTWTSISSPAAPTAAFPLHFLGSTILSGYDLAARLSKTIANA